MKYSVELDTMEPNNVRFRKFLAENDITVKPANDDPNGLSIAHTYKGSKEALEKLIDTHFLDDYLKDFIKPVHENLVRIEATVSILVRIEDDDETPDSVMENMDYEFTASESTGSYVIETEIREWEVK